MGRRSKRVKQEQEPTYVSMQLTLSLEPPPKQYTESLFMDVLDCALTSIFGIIGGAITLDMVDFDKHNATGRFHCKKSDQQRVWAAAAFMTQYKGSSCQLEVITSQPLKYIADLH